MRKDPQDREERKKEIVVGEGGPGEEGPGEGGPGSWDQPVAPPEADQFVVCGSMRRRASAKTAPSI